MWLYKYMIIHLRNYVQCVTVPGLQSQHSAAPYDVDSPVSVQQSVTVQFVYRISFKQDQDYARDLCFRYTVTINKTLQHTLTEVGYYENIRY